MFLEFNHSLLSKVLPSVVIPLALTSPGRLRFTHKSTCEGVLYVKGNEGQIMNGGVSPAALLPSEERLSAEVQCVYSRRTHFNTDLQLKHVNIIHNTSWKLSRRLEDNKKGPREPPLFLIKCA